MLKYYVNKRLKPLSFLVLATLLTMLMHSPETTKFDFLKRMVFLFASFLAFRFLDDAGSVRVDRMNHPDRLYLNVEHYPSFLLLTILINLTYLTTMYFIDVYLAFLLTLFWLFSVLMYFLFQDQRTILSIVPLLKYPLLLYGLFMPHVTMFEMFTCFGSFLMLVAYELLEDTFANLLKPLFIIICLLLSGFSFVFHAHFLVDAIFIGLPLIIYLLFSEKSYIKYLPILYYPICMFLKSIFL